MGVAVILGGTDGPQRALESGSLRFMERRDFAKKALLGAAGASVLGGCSDDDPTSDGAPNVQPNKQVRWKLASSFSRSLDTIYGAAEVLAERLNSSYEMESRDWSSDVCSSDLARIGRRIVVGVPRTGLRSRRPSGRFTTAKRRKLFGPRITIKRRGINRHD